MTESKVRFSKKNYSNKCRYVYNFNLCLKHNTDKETKKGRRECKVKTLKKESLIRSLSIFDVLHPVSIISLSTEFSPSTFKKTWKKIPTVFSFAKLLRVKWISVHRRCGVRRGMMCKPLLGCSASVLHCITVHFLKLVNTTTSLHIKLFIPEKYI